MENQTPLTEQGCTCTGPNSNRGELVHVLKRFWWWLRGHPGEPPNPDESLSPNEFTAIVARQIGQRFPDAGVAAKDALGLVIRRNGRELELHLDNTYRAYRLNPAGRDELVAVYIEGMLGRPDHRFTAAGARERLLPRLMGRQVFRPFRNLLVATPLAAGLMVTFVIDEADRMTYVTPDHLQEWELTMGDLQRIALENLAAVTEPGHLQPVDMGGTDHLLFTLNAPDGYAASRLLLTDRLLKWAGPLPGRPLLAAPARDTLYLWGEGDAMVTAAVERHVREAFRISPYPVHPHVLAYEGGQFLPHLDTLEEEDDVS